MAGFIYNGHSTEDYLSDNVTVAFFDGSPQGYGIDRDLEAGTPTIFRPVPNEYGTIDSPQEIEFTLLKCGGEVFSHEEQIRIETWLTAPTLSIPLYFVPNGKKSISGPTPYYYGIFTKTEWVPGGKGFLSVKLTFRPTTAYPFMKGITRIKLNGNEVTKKINITKVSDNDIYPVIHIKDNNGNFSVQNETLGDKKMNLTGLSKFDDVVIDCDKCIITGDGKALSFSQVGWTSVSDIVWLRLRQSVNNLELKGNGAVTISYEMPYKKVGGWFE